MLSTTSNYFPFHYRPCPLYFLYERRLCLFIEEVLTIRGFPLEEVFLGGPGAKFIFSLNFLIVFSLKNIIIRALGNYVKN